MVINAQNTTPCVTYKLYFEHSHNHMWPHELLRSSHFEDKLSVWSFLNTNNIMISVLIKVLTFLLNLTKFVAIIWYQDQYRKKSQRRLKGPTSSRPMLSSPIRIESRSECWFTSLSYITQFLSTDQLLVDSRNDLF